MVDIHYEDIDGGEAIPATNITIKIYSNMYQDRFWSVYKCGSES